MTTIGPPSPECADAQVIAIGANKFAIRWRGELRRKQYPTPRLAMLAIAALRQASMIPRDRTQTAARPG
jgi:hypothetical protein